jgi:bacteriocin-like protein
MRNDELPQTDELTDAELEQVTGGKREDRQKRRAARGRGSNASRGFPAPGYGDTRGYDGYGTHVG